MRQLIIKKHVITTPLIDILKQIRLNLNDGRLSKIGYKGDNIIITCPFHKDGKENKAACNVYIGDDSRVNFGTVHCFACGYKASFQQAVADMFRVSLSEAEDWLVDQYSNEILVNKELLPEINLDKPGQKNLDVKYLDQFNFYHPYMWQRKLTKEVVDKFRIGYDTQLKAITFPVWDEHDNLITVTKRSVENKKFFIESNIVKPIYLLNFIKKENIKTVYVCESQINALVCWSYGKPAIALFGTGSSHQYDILNRSGIRNFILLFDGDPAGRSGAERFIKNINKDCLITDILLPKGKDVADLDRAEFKSLLSSYNIS